MFLLLQSGATQRLCVFVNDRGCASPREAAGYHTEAVCHMGVCERQQQLRCSM